MNVDCCQLRFTIQSMFIRQVNKQREGLIDCVGCRDFKIFLLIWIGLRATILGNNIAVIFYCFAVISSWFYPEMNLIVYYF